MAERSSLVGRADHGLVKCTRCGRPRHQAGGRPLAEVCGDCRYVEGLTCDLDLDDVLVEFRRVGAVQRGTVLCHCGAALPTGAREPLDCTVCREWARTTAARASWQQQWWERAA